MIIGVDEAGRGPWAGPMVVCAVGLQPETTINGLNDSKQLSSARRSRLATEIKMAASYIAVFWIEPGFIDNKGLSACLHKGVAEVLEPLGGVSIKEIIIDGNVNYGLEFGARSQVRADGSVPAVAAASIIAKVARDNYMERITAKYSQYGFERHKGYGTAWHRACLDKFGASPIHRLSFAPVKEAVR